MGAPSEAGVYKPDNPARPKANHRAGTELCMQGGNELHGAIGKENIGHNASEGIEPRNNQRCTGPRVSFPGSQQRGKRYGELDESCRGLSPWQVIERYTSELGRAMSFLTEAPNKLKRRGGSMAAWQSDRLIVGE